MMKKVVLFCFCSILFFGCDKKNLSPAVSLYSTFTLYLQDENGKSLLDPATEGALDISKIDLSYVVDGVKVRQFDGMRRYPKSMYIAQHHETGVYSLTVFVNIEGEHGSINRNIIEYQGLKADTIDVKVYYQAGKETSARGYDQFWINGDEYDMASFTDHVLLTK